MEYKKEMCPICEIRTLKYYSRTHFNKTCGDKECVKKLHHITNLKIHGHISNLHGKNGRKKVAKTLKEKYGDEITNVSQIESVKKKKSKTCRKNFGVSHPMQSKNVREKSKHTVIEKYGVDNVSKSKEILEKIKNVMSKIDEKTGLSMYQLSHEKRKKINYEKYGFEYYFQTDEFKKKYIETCLKRYGADNFWKSKEFKKMMLERGIHIDYSKHPKIKEYYTKVKVLTEKVFKENIEYFLGVFVRGINYHLDHIFSIAEGYRQNIEPEIISSIVNLQLLPAKVNIKKQDDCWITKEELFRLYNNYKSKK